MKKGRAGEFHPHAKLSLPVALEIYKDIEDGMKTMKIAEKYDISRWIVHRMKNGTHWTYNYYRSH